MWRFAEIRFLPDIARYWGQKRPDKVALIQGAVTRTYAELDRRSSMIGNRLVTLGVRPGSPIGYVGRNSIEIFEAWFGAAKAGCPFVAFNWRSSSEELFGLIDDAGPPLVFVTAEFEPVMRGIQDRASKRFEIVVFDPAGPAGERLTSWIGGAEAIDPRITLTGTDIALLSYTSGTTGKPKGVQATHDAFNYSFLCGSLEPSMAWRDDDIMLMSMPNFHLAGSWVSIAALYHGATLSIIPAFDPGDFLETLRRDRPTIAPLVPTAIQMLLNRPDLRADDFASLRSVLYFGSPIAKDMLLKATQTLGCAFNQYYGTTETWFVSVLRHDQHISGNEARLTSCGVPLPLIMMKIVDELGNEVATGTVGHLLVRTPMALSGYWNRPDATAEVLNEGWYQTGDLARQDAEGYFYLVDRAKDMIITGGENVYSVEVEAALLKHSGVSMAAAIGVKDERWGEKVVALVVLVQGTVTTEDEIKDHCRRHLAGYKVPKSILFETALPLTPSGKVQKAVLRQRFRV